MKLKVEISYLNVSAENLETFFELNDLPKSRIPQLEKYGSIQVGMKDLNDPNKRVFVTLSKDLDEDN